ncbi:MAG: FAD-dependent oxidoreductase [Desulfovibrionaceae bacterium]|nr:FAD-dependent oxidoreductase [Desulfovibrionaceae bacterium]
MNARVAVLGAAPEQLAAAVRLARAGIGVSVLEPGAQVGGRAAAARRDGWIFDGPGAWLWGMEANGPMGRLLHELAITAPVFELHGEMSLRHGSTEVGLTGYPTESGAALEPVFGPDFAQFWVQCAELGLRMQNVFTDAVDEGAASLEAVLAPLAALYSNPPLPCVPDMPALGRVPAARALQGPENAVGAALLDALCRTLVGQDARRTSLAVAAASLAVLERPLFQPPDGVGGFMDKLVAAIAFHHGAVRANAPVAAIARTATGWAVRLAGGEVVEADALVAGRDLARFLPAFDAQEREGLRSAAGLAGPQEPLVSLTLGGADRTGPQTHAWSVAALENGCCALLSLQAEGYAPEGALAATAAFCGAPVSIATRPAATALAADAALAAPLDQAGTAELADALLALEPGLILDPSGPDAAPGGPAPLPAPQALTHADGAACAPAIDDPGASAAALPPGLLLAHQPALMGRDVSFSLWAAVCAARRLAADLIG